MSRKGVFLILFASYFMLNAFDLITTTIDLSKSGVREANPLFNSFNVVGITFWDVCLKCFLVPSFVLFSGYMSTRKIKIPIESIFLLFLVAEFLYTVVNNIIVYI